MRKLILGVVLSAACAASAVDSAKPVDVLLFIRGPGDPSLPPPDDDTGQIGVDVAYPVLPDIRALAQFGARAVLRIALPDGSTLVVPVSRFTPVEGFNVDESFDVVVDPAASDSELTFHWYGVARGVEVALTVHRGTLAGRLSDSRAPHSYSFALDGAQPIMRALTRDAIPVEPPDAAVGGGIATTILRQLMSPKRAKVAETVDVLILYTPNALNVAGGQANLDALISSSVANMATAFANSEVVSVNLNNVLPNGAQGLLVNYDEENNCIGLAPCSEVREFEFHKRALRTDLAVIQLRNQFAADLVVTFVGDASACGIAYTQRGDCGERTGEDDQCFPGAEYDAFAYSVVSTQPACENWNFAHEVGHQFGMEHDPQYAAPVGEASFAWSYAHKVSNANVQARDVMAYVNGCAFGCPVTLQYSNPQHGFVTFPAEPSGTTVADAAGRTRFNALTAAVLSEAMANFRGPDVTDRIFRNDLESLPNF